MDLQRSTLGTLALESGGTLRRWSGGFPTLARWSEDDTTLVRLTGQLVRSPCDAWAGEALGPETAWRSRGNPSVEGCAHCALRGCNLRSARVTMPRW
jgi:hypothetical protein